jgi:BlaI family penicillinase repressor
MQITPRISETEWEVMRIVWARHPLPAADIIAALQAQDQSWHPKTARTLLARLVRKGALDYQPQGRAYVYEPKVTERECIAAASDSFLDRVFGGALQPMLVHFVKERRLSRKDLAELRRIVDAADPKESRGKK